MDEWKDYLGYDEDKPGDKMILRMKHLETELDKVKATEKALRDRCREKAETNVRLSEKNTRINNKLELKKTECRRLIKQNQELKGDVGNFKKSVDMNAKEVKEYKQLNDHHKEQLEIANDNIRRGHETIEKLHKQIHAMDEKRKAERIRAEVAEAELDRKNRIVDHIVGKGE